GLAGRPEGLVGCLLARDRCLGVRRREGRPGDAGDADPGPTDRPVAADPDDRGHAGGREVADAPLELRVGAALAARRAAEADLREDLGRLDGRGEGVEEEVAGGDQSLAGWTAADDPRVHREERRGP